jgi:site-specific DNA-adenine methylase
MVRLNDDGSIDTGFDSISAGGFDLNVFTVALTNDGSSDIYVGGQFTSYNGTTVNRLVRLNSNGSIDTGFDTITGGGFTRPFLSGVAVEARAILVDTSGDIFVAGQFVDYNGTSVGSLVRINNDGSLDTNLDPYSKRRDYVRIFNITSAVDGSNDLFISGLFSTFNGTTVIGLARIAQDGTVD